MDLRSPVRGKAVVYAAAWLALCGGAGQAQTAPGKLTELQNFSASLEALAQRVNRAVVKIVTTGYGLSEPSDTGATALIMRQRATGSGVLLSADGYIATNAHVIRGARRIRVELALSEREEQHGHSVLKPSGSVLDAKVVGQDRETDLAILKIQGSDFPHLELGDSHALRQGQLVMAFGSPLGLQNSASLGVISSVARQIKPDSPMIYIQTDASINPGNSGGPLVDMTGRVVGINTMILSESGGSEGIGFAIPSHILQNVYQQIRKEGHVHRGQIGISVQTITPLLAAGLKLPRDWGVLVSDVVPDGPADDSGIEIGDIVLSLNGRTMENARQLEVNLYRYPLGEQVNLEILRGERRLSVQVPVTSNDEDPARFADMVNPDRDLIPKLGILGIPIDKRLAGMLSDLRVPSGIVVAARTADADSLGVDLRSGDVIHAINSQAVTTVAGLRTALEQLKSGDPVVLQVERDGQMQYVAFEME
jgi:serine protease Do